MAGEKSPALLFGLGVFAPVSVNYSSVADLVPPGLRSTIANQNSDKPAAVLSSLREKKSGEYEALRDKIAEHVGRIELAELEKARLFPGVKVGLESAQTLKVRLVLISELGEKAVETFLFRNGIRSKIHHVFARKEIDDSRKLEEIIQSCIKELGLEARDCIFFCNTIREIKAAKSCNLRVVVFPNAKEGMDAVMRAGPDGVLINLEELTALLSLKSWHFEKRSTSVEKAP